jgi:hypothetical protein
MSYVSDSSRDCIVYREPPKDQVLVDLIEQIKCLDEEGDSIFEHLPKSFELAKSADGRARAHSSTFLEMESFAINSKSRKNSA